MGIREIRKQLSGVFKLPKRRYYLGRVAHGAPYFYPRNYVGSVAAIDAKYPTFAIFGIPIRIGFPVVVKSYGLGYKDKFDTPRLEWVPTFHIFFFGLQFSIFHTAPIGSNEGYYEQALWYLKYCDRDIAKAKDTWGWTDLNSGRSTWNDIYLL